MSNQPNHYQPARRRNSGMSGLKVRLVVAFIIVAFSVVSFLAKGSRNSISGERQYVSMNEDQEIALGIRATPSVVNRHNGFSRDATATRVVKNTGARLVNSLYLRLQREGKRLPYSFEFHLLADSKVINAFALPGGQIFLTEALFQRLTHPGQLAGVLGHEIGHVVERHGAQRITKGELFQSVNGAVGVATADRNSANMANMVTGLIENSYGRGDELQSDRWGIELMVLTGYDPRHMLEVMDVLENATSNRAPPEFLSTHPKPRNRKRYINRIIAEKFPNGIPSGLK